MMFGKLQATSYAFDSRLASIWPDRWHWDGLPSNTFFHFCRNYAQSSLIPLLHQISSRSWTGYVRVPGTFLLATEPAPFPPVLSEAIIILDASSVEDVAQCTGKVNSSSKTVDHIDYMQAFALLDQLLMIRRQFLTWLLHCYHLHLLCPTCRMWHAPWFCQSLLFRSRRTCYFLASAGNQLLRFQTSLFFSKNALNVS